jgi:hypothetical protein
LYRCNAANLCLEYLDDSPRWRGLMLVPLLPTAAVALVMVPRLPESPRWLMSRGGEPGREAAAREVLVRTCGEAAAGPALADIKSVLAQQDDCGGDAKGHGASSASTWWGGASCIQFTRSLQATGSNP